MTDTIVGNGHCLCGKVEVTTNTMGRHIDSCHFRMCRRRSGGPLMGVDCGTDVEFVGEENIEVYRSSGWA